MCYNPLRCVFGIREPGDGGRERGISHQQEAFGFLLVVECYTKGFFATGIFYLRRFVFIRG